MFWASHVVHHSSQHYNLSTALRQTWVPMTAFPSAALAPIGIKPWMIVLQHRSASPSQFFITPSASSRCPRRRRPGPDLRSSRSSTPSAVRHGLRGRIEHVRSTRSPRTIAPTIAPTRLYRRPGRNYGGILIIWDRLLGTFQGETEAVRYGLTKNIETHNPARVAFHEYAAIARDVAGARGWRERSAGTCSAGPGWTPARRAGVVITSR